MRPKTCPTSGHPAILRSRNPKKTLDNPYTHMITSVMLPRQIPLLDTPNQSNSFIPTLLQPLCSRFPTPVVCFQQLTASFHKTPGWGWSSSHPLFGISNIQNLFPYSCLHFGYPHPHLAASPSNFRVSYFGLRYNPLALPTPSPTATVQPRPHRGIPNTFEVS